ncbi:hypothetical protein L208DRAFT_1420007 [Tricholoma matsutake]|nr:hypothetical protein L208DRAFT_1420007 [Tricholoma matsutake 945]
MSALPSPFRALLSNQHSNDAYRPDTPLNQPRTPRAQPRYPTPPLRAPAINAMMTG